MMKKLLVCLLMVLLMACAYADEKVPSANVPVDYTALERYVAYSMNEATGAWTVHTNEADALLDWFWEDGNRQNEAVIFYLEVSGDADTTVITPALKAMYIGPKRVEATSVSILLNEKKRYDFAGATRQVTRGSKTAEETTFPLNQQAMEFITALSGAKSVRIRLMGRDVDTTVADSGDSATFAKMAFTSVTGAAAAKKLVAAVGLNEYALWDYTAAVWEQQGIPCLYKAGNVQKTVLDTTLRDAFGMILVDDSGTVVTNAQKLLISAGFMAGKTEKTMTSRVVTAVRRAQRHYGLVETGAIDATLVSKLSSGTANKTAQAPVFAGTPIGERVEVSLTRYWVAGAVNAKKGTQADRLPDKTDNMLLVVNGKIRNTHDAALRLGVEVRAEMVCNGKYRFHAMVVCESSGATKLDSQLIPGAAADVLIYAEVPQYLAEDADAVWTLELSAGTETATYTLE